MKEFGTYVGMGIVVGLILYGAWGMWGTFIRYNAAQSKPAPGLTAKDVLLALEAHEVKCKPCPCGEGSDELAKQFAKTLRAEGIPTLPGVSR